MKITIYTVIVFIYFSFKCQFGLAYLDFLTDSVRDAAKGSAYANAITELADELDHTNSLSPAVSEQEKRIERIKALTQKLESESKDVKKTIDETDWSRQSIEDSIRYTTKFVNRLKRLLFTAGALGPDVATAVNTAETNGALKELLKSQQTLNLLHKEDALKREEADLKMRLEWSEFIKSERAIRSKVSK